MSAFPQSLHTNAAVVPESGPRPLPSTCIHKHPAARSDIIAGTDGASQSHVNNRSSHAVLGCLFSFRRGHLSVSLSVALRVALCAQNKSTEREAGPRPVSGRQQTAPPIASPPPRINATPSKRRGTIYTTHLSVTKPCGSPTRLNTISSGDAVCFL